MKLRALQATFAALLLAVASQAIAEDMQGYWGLGVGYSKAKLNSDDFDQSQNFPGINETAKGTDVGYKAFLGIPKNKNLMIELSYVNLGKFHYNYQDPAGGGQANVDYSVTGYGVSVLPTLPIGNSFSLYARLGVFFSEAKASNATYNGTLAGGIITLRNGTDSARSLLAGGGMQVNVSSDTALRLDYEYYGLTGGPNSGHAKIQMLSANLVFMF